MKKLENNKGITLVSLVITIILLIILASIGTYSGIQVVKSAQFTAFSTELKIMQTQVNKLYEEKRNGNDEYVDSLGVEINSDTNIQKQANKVFTASGITDQNEYKYFDTDTIKRLNIEGVEREFFVNINKRSVVSYNGFEYEGKAYYTVNQLDNNSLYNVEYNNTNNWDPSKDSFNIEYNEVEEGKYRITVSNIDYKSGNINKWQVKYKKENEEEWKQANNYSFIIDELGNYRVKIANNNTESNEKQIKAKSSFLPSEFQEVEYIESTGTQYIKTGIQGKNNTYIEVDVFPKNDTLYQSVFGLNYGVNINYELGSYRGPGTESISKAISGYDNVIGFIDSNGQRGETINGVTSVGSTARDKGEIYLFCWQNYNTCFEGNGSANDSPTFFIGRLKKAAINQENELKRNLIPCYSITTVNDVSGYEYPEDTRGLYDTVNNQFYVNKGSGTFEKGNDIDSGETINTILINDM